MGREYSRAEVLSILRKAHDEIINHEFRLSFSQKHAVSYKEALYHLTDAWCNFVYYMPDSEYISEEEKKIFHIFGRWIHNYRSELLSCRTINWEFPMQYFPYYEKMISVTHEFLDYGTIDCFYEIDDRQKHEGPNYTKFVLLTKQNTGIVSNNLPLFLPAKLIETDETIVHDFIKKRCTSTDSEEAFESWKNNMKPLLEWNNNKLPKETPKYPYIVW